MEKVLEFTKKYKLLLAGILILIIVLYGGLKIYYRLSEPIGNQEQELKNIIIASALKYKKIIESDITKNGKDSIYYINDKSIIKRDLNHKKEEVLTNTDETTPYIIQSDFYGLYLPKESGEQYFLQSGEYCVKNKNGNVKIKKEVCNQLGSEKNISDVILKYSTVEELTLDTIETGKDESLPFSSKLYFKGQNPNNYIIYGNACYRIMNITQNGSVKIIYEGLVNKGGNCKDVATNVSGFVALLAWDSNKTSDVMWNEPTQLNLSMQKWIRVEKINMENFKVDIDPSKLQLADWNIGRVLNNTRMMEDIQNERSITSQGYIGLINPSDYNKINCKASVINSSHECIKNNYLYKEKYGWWTMNRSADEKKSSWSIDITGSTISATVPFSNEYSYKGIRPVFYLKSDSLITGIGTEYIPYRFHTNK